MLRNEVLLVLGLTLGRSAVYAIIAFIDLETRNLPLSQQTARLNVSQTPDRPWLDLAYQLYNIFFGLVVPTLLVIYLLNRTMGWMGTRDTLGLTLNRWRFDLATGAGLAAVIGVPGLFLYLGARALGYSVTVAPANLTDVWWSVPVLVLSAAGNAALEEFIMVGYLLTRLRELGWQTWRAVLVTALIRGTYHIYQGWGALLGNAIMGVVFALFFLRTKRLLPLVLAHTLLDVVAFVGYTLLRDHVSWL